ncbi:PAAR domain-containing protein [Pseudomonas sp. OTU5201]|uniref:PAAR domain-containing protein n=1 Tax=Pseudomonas sp. OTU5201 TaxID=3043850 RepID=UPI00313CF267
MATGYFIRLGDKTTCGGTVLEADTRVMMFGIAHARQGDRVSCGKDGKVYRIIGGVSFISSHGAPVAGTLDSLSGCPCRAKLLPSLFSATYQSDRGEAKAKARPAPAPAVATAPLAATPSSAAPKPTVNNLLEEEEEEEELEETGIVLRLGLFFDGTGNNQANSEAAAGCWASDVGLTSEAAEDVRQRCAALGYDGKGNTPDNSYGNDVSNVARLYALYPDDTLMQLPPGAEEAYLKVYLEGIGTHSGLGDSLYSQGTGQGETGVVARVEQMPALFMEQLRRFRTSNSHVKIRRIEIDLFGFSRGAAAARHCANDLLKGRNSLLARALPAGSPFLATGFAWRHRSDVILNFIGLFDTVPGIVSLGSFDFSPHNADNPGLDLRLAPGAAHQVIHLVAADEYRHNFSLVEAEENIVLPGSHSDIGGGYLPLAREKLLLSKPDSSLEIDRLANERSAAFFRTRQRFNQEARRWLAYVPPEGLDIVTWSVQTRHRARDTQAEKRVYAAISSERDVRGELSLVYLRIMREWAVRAGVAFRAVPHTQAFALPSELQPIAAKLQAFALRETFTPLTGEEIALLRRRYIHLSANWNATKGWNNSALNVVFVNRPAEGMQRKEHPNE